MLAPPSSPTPFGSDRPDSRSPSRPLPNASSRAAQTACNCQSSLSKTLSLREAVSRCILKSAAYLRAGRHGRSACELVRLHRLESLLHGSHAIPPKPSNWIACAVLRERALLHTDWKISCQHRHAARDRHGCMRVLPAQTATARSSICRRRLLWSAANLSGSKAETVFFFFLLLLLFCVHHCWSTAVLIE